MAIPLMESNAVVEEAAADATATMQQLPFGLDMLGDVIPILQDTVNNLLTNTSPAEVGVILLGIGIAYGLFRANFWIQMILKFAGLLIVVGVIAILFGVVSF